jgi:hypothetical protein
MSSKALCCSSAQRKDAFEKRAGYPGEIGDVSSEVDH